MNTSVSEHTYHLRGLSTDQKPILEKLSNGSSFLEIDTGKFYTILKYLIVFYTIKKGPTNNGTLPLSYSGQ